jgi:hypothetical protein
MDEEAIVYGAGMYAGYAAWYLGAENYDLKKGS